MAKLRVHNFSVSIDGYAAGPHQDIDNPLGVGGMGPVSRARGLHPCLAWIHRSAWQ